MGNGTEKNVEEVGVADERVEEKAVLGSDRLNKSQVEEAFKEAVETQEHLDERGTIAKSGDGEIGNSTLEEVLAVEKSLAEAVSLESHQETESSKEILTEASDNGVLDITLVGADDVNIEKGLAAEENLWHKNSETDSKNNAIEKFPLKRRQKKQLGNRIEEVEEEEEPEATSNMSITATLKPSISELDLDRPNIEDYLPSGSSIHQEPHGKLRLRDLLDISPTLTEAAGAIVDDSFTRCFKSNFPEPWNWNVYLFPLWCCGVVIRYLILFPVRVIVLTLGWIIFLSAYIPVHFLLKGHDKWRKKSERFLVELICSFFVASWTGVVKYHGPRPSMRPNQVFVANHTSMIDFIILEQMTAFSVIMQKHVGWVGLLQSTILESVGCIWFNRTESKDREIVARKLREHVQGADNPLLIFPEGTCVNNHYTVMFKKGAFELGCSVCPIAIKYNKIFVDAFWNSRKQSFTKHLLQLMTSWAVVCDVWYLEPQTLRPGETPIEFAERVRGIISARANLKKVPWDGYLKHSRPSPKHRERKQQGFAESVLRRLEEK